MKIKNRFEIGFLLLFIVLACSIALHVEKYFNLKEIKLASSRCYEAGGEVIVEIYNELTGSYYFECKPK